VGKSFIVKNGSDCKNTTLFLFSYTQECFLKIISAKFGKVKIIT